MTIIQPLRLHIHLGDKIPLVEEFWGVSIIYLVILLIILLQLMVFKVQYVRDGNYNTNTQQRKNTTTTYNYKGISLVGRWFGASMWHSYISYQSYINQ